MTHQETSPLIVPLEGLRQEPWREILILRDWAHRKAHIHTEEQHTIRIYFSSHLVYENAYIAVIKLWLLFPQRRDWWKRLLGFWIVFKIFYWFSPGTLLTKKGTLKMERPLWRINEALSSIVVPFKMEIHLRMPLTGLNAEKAMSASETWFTTFGEW